MLGCAHVAAWCGYCYHRGREVVFAEEGKEDAFGMGNNVGVAARRGICYHRGREVFFAEEGKEDAFGMGNNVGVAARCGICYHRGREVVFTERRRNLGRMLFAIITEETRFFSQRKGKRMPTAWGITWLWGVDWGMQGCGRPNTIV